MRHLNTREVPGKTETFVEKVTCDLCGKEARHTPNNLDECQIACRTGVCDPDGGGEGRTTSVDMCSQCFGNKLVPWLVRQGVTLRVEDWDC